MKLWSRQEQWRDPSVDGPHKPLYTIWWDLENGTVVHFPDGCRQAVSDWNAGLTLLPKTAYLAIKSSFWRDRDDNQPQKGDSNIWIDSYLWSDSPHPSVQWHASVKREGFEHRSSGPAPFWEDGISMARNALQRLTTGITADIADIRK